MAISTSFLGRAQAATSAVDVAITISAGTNRLLFVSTHARGNPGTSDISVQLRTASGGGGTLIANLTNVLDVEADSILHAEFFQLLEASIPSPGTYYVRVITSGAFQVGGGVLMLGNVDQTQAVSPTTSSLTNSGGTSISQTITVPATSGIILDNWSGDGSNTAKSPDVGETRDSDWLTPKISQNDLKAGSAYTASSSSGTKTFGWSGLAHNRNALGILFYQEEAGGTDVDLEGSASGETTTIGTELAVDTPLEGTASGETTTTADLDVALGIELEGSASGETTETAALAVDTPLEGSATGTTSVLFALLDIGLKIDLAGEISGSTETNASIAVDTPLEGSASGETTVSGDLISSPLDIILISSSTYGSTVVSGSISVDTTLAGEASGETTLNGSIEVGDYSLIHLINRNPEPAEDDVPVDANVVLDIANTGPLGINLNETRVFVNGEAAYFNGVFQPGWDGPGSSTFSVGVNGDTERITIDPTTDFDSTEVVEVCVETENGDGTISLSTCYSFTVEDLTPPGVFEVVAIDLDQVEVTFTEPVNDTALDPANYTFAAVLDPDLLQCVVEVEAVSVSRTDDDTIVITTDIELSHGRIYQLTVENVEDENGNAITSATTNFVAFEPVQPEDRDFDLWRWMPEVNRREDDDGSGDLRRWICIVQECSDLLLFSIDRWTRILDVDIAPERFVDAMLADLGNPFVGFVLSEVDKRRLARVLVEIYKQKGLAKGIKNVARFFLGIEIEILPFVADGMELGISELGIDWILGTGSQRELYTFNVEVPVNLTDEERRRLLQIIDYMKPAHTHLGELIEPEIPEVFDHWELGFSELGETTLLH